MGDKNVREITETWFASDELTKCPRCGRPKVITTQGGVTYCFGCETMTSPTLPQPLPPELTKRRGRRG